MLVELPALARPEERPLGDLGDLARERGGEQLAVGPAQVASRAAPRSARASANWRAKASSRFRARRDSIRTPASGEAGSRRTSWYS